MGFIEPPPKISFSDLRAKLFDLMQQEHYAANSINTFRKICDLLDQYLSARGITEYDSSVGQSFLSDCTKYRGKVVNGKRVMTDTVLTLICTLDNIVNFNELRPKNKEKTYPCPDCYSHVLLAYLEYIREKGYRPSTIDNHYRYTAEFLTAIEKQVSSLTQITTEILYPSFEPFALKGESLYVISGFLRYIYQEKLVKDDFSLIIQYPRRPQNNPSVYTKDEMIRTFQCIDRHSAKGKRDFAMVLLAYRLGLRASDISGLKFSNIDFDKNRINIVQIKTQVPLSLPLTPEVKSAIQEYLAVRPASSSQEIFLRTRAPFIPMRKTSENSALSKYFKMAGVDPTGRKHGLHSLRSTLASELVAENISYTVTQKILGHTNSAAINHYVKLDIEALRECALPVSPASGQFKMLLEQKEAAGNV